YATSAWDSRADKGRAPSCPWGGWLGVWRAAGRGGRGGSGAEGPCAEGPCAEGPCAEGPGLATSRPAARRRSLVAAVCRPSPFSAARGQPVLARSASASAASNVDLA